MTDLFGEDRASIEAEVSQIERELAYPGLTFNAMFAGYALATLLDRRAMGAVYEIRASPRYPLIPRPLKIGPISRPWPISVRKVLAKAKRKAQRQARKAQRLAVQS